MCVRGSRLPQAILGQEGETLISLLGLVLVDEMHPAMIVVDGIFCQLGLVPTDEMHPAIVLIDEISINWVKFLWMRCTCHNIMNLYKSEFRGTWN